MCTDCIRYSVECSRDSSASDKYSEFQGFIMCTNCVRYSSVSSRNSNSPPNVIMELVFDSRVELTVSNWRRNNEYSCSEEKCLCTEADNVQSVGWGLHYLPARDALVTAAQCQLHIRSTTLAMPNCSLCAGPYLRTGPRGPGPGRQIFRGGILKKSRLKYGMRKKMLSTREKFKGDLY